jgi:hypothetical protein
LISQQKSGSTNSIIYYSLFVVVDVESEGVWRVQQHKRVGHLWVHKRGTIGVETLLA